MVKIYGPKRSNAGRCHVLAKEIGLEYEAVPVNFPKREHNSPEYLNKD
ncbi:hypothetical protein ACFLZG_02525 [Thermodesulfobacteriota bacterium]